MRRIVTAVNDAGRSYVASDDVLPDEPGLHVFDFKPNGQLSKWIADLDPDLTANWIGPSVAGGATWILADIPPYGLSGGHGERQGMDADGFHTTNTIDFVYVIRGPLTLILDEDTVELEAGDAVIQQATRHAWRNGEGGSSHIALLLWPQQGSGDGQ